MTENPACGEYELRLGQESIDLSTFQCASFRFASVSIDDRNPSYFVGHCGGNSYKGGVAGKVLSLKTQTISHPSLPGLFGKIRSDLPYKEEAFRAQGHKYMYLVFARLQ
jgi:hypothetical protein